MLCLLTSLLLLSYSAKPGVPGDSSWSLGWEAKDLLLPRKGAFRYFAPLRLKFIKPRGHSPQATFMIDRSISTPEAVATYTRSAPYAPEHLAAPPGPLNSSENSSDSPDQRSPALSARWQPRSVALIVAVWLVLHIGGLFSPGLLDDVDSVYIEIAREMLQRHDFVTPYVDGIRFFDKPPLLYWLAAASMRLFGIHDWAARLPLALLTLALLLATYALGLRLFAAISPAHARDRGALYSALALATALGPYLYTRFFIPDIVVTLWLTLSIHLFLIALERARNSQQPSSRPEAKRSEAEVEGPAFSPPTPNSRVPHSSQSHRDEWDGSNPLLPMLGFAATLAASTLTKGLIGLVFPLGFAAVYLLLTRRTNHQATAKGTNLLRRLHLPAATATFLALSLPWHVLIALRNPAIPLPPGLGLPAHGGWAWFYLYNEHIARFLSRRIPHDYGQVPIPLFWALAALWIFPWLAFLPGALAQRYRELRGLSATGGPRCHEAAIALTLWIALVLGFFTLSARQEYYSLPAIPALALLAGGLLARADRNLTPEDRTARSSALRWSKLLLVPLGTLLALVAAFLALTAHPAPAGTDIATLLDHSEQSYNLSLSHLFDLTPTAMGLFRGPLALVALAMFTLGPVAWLIRRRGHTLAANLTLAIASVGTLLAVHAGLTQFYPTLGSKSLAEAIARQQHRETLSENCHPERAEPDERPPSPCAAQPSDLILILIDGELTAGSTLLFYLQQPVHLVDGRVNGPWYGSFWPDSPPIFETEATLRRLWAGPRRIFLLTYHPADRTRDLAPLAPTHTLAASGGKSILTNRP